MRYTWFTFGLGMLLLTAPAEAERDQNYKKFRNGNVVTNFTSAPSKKKKARQEPVFVANRGTSDSVEFGQPSRKQSLRTERARLTPDVDVGSVGSDNDQGNLPYVPEKLEFLRALRFDEPRPADAISGAVYDALLAKNVAAIRVTAGERKAAMEFYRSSGFKPIWIEDGAISDRAKKLEAFFLTADEDGLDPDEFGLPVVDSSDLASIAQYELRLTAAALKYARQASGGRLIPSRLTTYNDIKPERVDAAEALKILAYSPFPVDYLKRLQPSHPAYTQFKAALADLRKSPGLEDDPIPAGPKVKPGQVNVRIPAVRAYLSRRGYLPANLTYEDLTNDGVPRQVASNASYDSASELLDRRLARALKEFQKERNLKPTGVLDNQTVNAINAHTEKQDMLKLIVNMERMRWLPKHLGERFIIVNQPAFELRVMDSDRVIWRTNVVVGKPNTQTSAFHDELETVVFNPPWGVPASIVTKEMLPILWRDPSYLDRQGFKVYDQKGKVIRSSAINWSAYGENPPFSVQQPPGDDNALGELKFLFPNSHAIYMHDTPSKSLFSKPVRAFSHGCVRVQNPRELARVVLGMSPEKIEKRLASGKSETVPVPQKLPVHIVYFTAWPDNSGKINYYSDIYGRDASINEVFTVLRVAQR